MGDMIFGKPPAFGAIIETLKELENEINKAEAAGKTNAASGEQEQES